MNKIIVLLFLTIGFISCKNSEKEIDKLKIAKQYYKVLDNSDDTKITTLLTDSLLTRESQYDYEQTFSLNEYIEWLKWDSAFEPTYDILQIEQENETVKVKVSKTDKRILFLHEEPIVSYQVLRFNKDKIVSVETTEYIIFNDSTFVKNRTKFLDWINKNHPNLNGFIHVQTKSGATKYLEAIELYKNR